jgi:rubrerythrin
MNQEKFNEIIDFAIKREQEAVEFYQELQNLVSFESRKELMHELELMEKGHIKILENISKNFKNETSIPQVEDLKIADYMVEVKPTAEMSYQDILIIAMKKEEMAQKLYKKLADQSDNDEIKNLFLRLASEEAKHKLRFEKIYDDDILKEN